MAKGLKTGGRVKGTINKRTEARKAAITTAVEQGLSPLQYMLDTLRNDDADPRDRQWAASNAAPYLHAKLSNIELTGAGGGPVLQRVEMHIVDPQV